MRTISRSGSLKKRPLDYFKSDFYADSAVFGSRAATICGLDFYGPDRVVFASDCPFDPRGGPGTSARRSRSRQPRPLQGRPDKIYFGNLEKLTGASL